VLGDLVTSHEFGHSAGLAHTTTRLNLMYPSVTPGLDDCTDSLDDGQLTTMAANLGVGTSAASGALRAGTGAAPFGPGATFERAGLRALLGGDRETLRSFVRWLFHGHAV
jgi:hypothetical protein